MRVVLALLIALFTAQAQAAGPKHAKFKGHSGGNPCGSAVCTGGVFKTLPIGGGGLFLSYDITCDQGISSYTPIVLNCSNGVGSTSIFLTDDTYGAWYYDRSKDCGNTLHSVTPGMKGCWTFLINSSNTPNGNDVNSAAYVAAAPSNNNTVYYLSRGDTGTHGGNLYKSTDKGVTWGTTALSSLNQVFTADKEFDEHYLAVDPANASIVYVGHNCTETMQWTNDGGTTFNPITAITYNTGGGNCTSQAAFDPTSPVTGSVTQRVCVASYLEGIWCSVNGGGTGGTWTQIANTSGTGPASGGVVNIVFDPAGNLWALSDHETPVSQGVWRYIPGTPWTSGVWTHFTAFQSADAFWASIAPQPALVSGHVLVAFMSNGGGVSFYNGTSFTTPEGDAGGDPNTPGDLNRCGSTGMQTCRIAADVPWLAWTNEKFMTGGSVRWDPTVTNRLLFAEGIGSWETIADGSFSNPSWTSITAGSENLVGLHITSPPGGGVIAWVEDRNEFLLTNPGTYPSVHGCAIPQVNPIVYGNNGDYAGANTSVVAGICQLGADTSGVSTDGGVTFSAFADYTPDQGNSKQTGCIALQDANHILWAPGGGSAHPYFTNNGGAVSGWGAISASPINQTTGWNDGRGISGCAADRVNHKFYLYNFQSTASDFFYSCDSGSPVGTTDCSNGANWVQKCTVCAPAGFGGAGSLLVASTSSNNARIRAIAGQANTLIIASDNATTLNTMFMTTDGGATWNAVQGPSGQKVANVFGWGQGAACNGALFTIYWFGFYNGVQGVFEGDYNGSTWSVTTISGIPGSLAFIADVSGDMATCGTIYAATATMGFTYRTKN